MDDKSKQSGSTATLDAPDDTSDSLSSLFSAKGKIFDDKRQGVPLTTVTFYDENNDPVGTTITDVSGNYELGLEKGKYRLEARDSAGKLITRSSFSLDQPDAPPLELVVEPVHEEDHKETHKDNHLYAPHPRTQTKSSEPAQKQPSTTPQEQTSEQQTTVPDVEQAASQEPIVDGPETAASADAWIKSQQTSDVDSLKNMGFDVEKLKALREKKRSSQSGFTQQDAVDTANAASVAVRNEMIAGITAAEQEEMQQEQMSRAQMIEQTAAQIAEIQNQKIFQGGEIEKDNRTQEEKLKNPAPQRKGAIDKVSNTIQTARKLKKRTTQTVQAVRLAVQAFRIPLPILGIILLILLFVAILIGIIATLYNDGFFKSVQDKPIRLLQNFELIITGPRVGKVGETLKYDISINYVENPQIPYGNITVQYKIPDGTRFVNATGGSDVNNQTGIVSWNLGRVENRAGFSIYIIPTQDNFILKTQVIASSTTGGLPYNPGLGIEDTPSGSSMDLAFKLAAQTYKIPVAFLKAIAKKESGLLSFNQAEYDKFNSTNWFVGLVDYAAKLEDNHPDIIRGYAYNRCLYSIQSCYEAGQDVRGAMPIDLVEWNLIKNNITTIVGREADRRYVKDNILGATLLFQNKIEPFKDRFGPFSDTNWTQEQVKAMARIYCAGDPDADVKFDRKCGVVRNGTTRVGYDEIIWEYYQEFKALGN